MSGEARDAVFEAVISAARKLKDLTKGPGTTATDHRTNRTNAALGVLQHASALLEALKLG